MKRKFIEFLTSNFIIWAFWLIAVLIELMGVCVTSGKFYIRNPFMLFSIIGIFTAVLFSIKNQSGRYWCAFVMMCAIFVVDLVFTVVFAATGGSLFFFSMLNLRGDAMTAVSTLQISFVFVLVCGLAISLYAVLSRYAMKLVSAPKRILPKAAVAALMAAVLVFHGGMAYYVNCDYNPSDLTYLLYSGSDGAYSDKGILGNFVSELYKGAFFSEVPLGDTDELDSFIYSSINEPTKDKLVFNKAIGETEVFGAAEDYNVVTVLAESLEWFSFMANLADAGFTDENPAYPYGFAYSFQKEKDMDSADLEKMLRDLYPNLYKLYDTSVVALNHHSREKTDVSENHSIIGSYPTDRIINYDYPDNTVPFSLPNMLKSLDPGIRSRSYHNGNATFYNRNEHHKNVLGFEKFTAVEQMMEMAEEQGVTALVDGDKAWDKNKHNFDSEMIEVCKEDMFPQDVRFNTYITTIVMHGMYDFQENLVPYYRMLIERGIAEPYIKDNYYEPILGENATEEEKYEAVMKAKIEALKSDDPDPFIHYAAAAIDFDRAMGKMLDYLESTDDLTRTNPDGTHPKLIEHTLITIFGDHNAYYQALGETVKDLSTDGKNGRNYTDLFRVPLIIHVGDQTEQIRIEKFTCTVDIVPTILDLLGIYFYNSLNYGVTIFDTETESMLYSCSYFVFITDKLFFTSINNIRFAAAGTTKDDVTDAEKRALTLLDKTGHINRIFYHDYLSGKRATEYYLRLRGLNYR